MVGRGIEGVGVAVAVAVGVTVAVDFGVGVAVGDATTVGEGETVSVGTGDTAGNFSPGEAVPSGDGCVAVLVGLGDAAVFDRPATGVRDLDGDSEDLGFVTTAGLGVGVSALRSIPR